MKAMIFAAGLGRRLGEITETIPKIMVDIAGKSLLCHIVEKCSSEGFDDMVINVHHHSGLVVDEVNRLVARGYRIEVSDESDQLLETGGGLYKARGFFGNEPFLVYNGDILTDVSLGELYDRHMEKNGLATLLVRNRSGNRFMLVDEKNRIWGWRNKSTGENILPVRTADNLLELAFSGIHIVDPVIFSFMEEGVYGLMPLYLDLMGQHDFFAYRKDEGYWFDIGTKEKLEEARRYMAFKK